MSDVSTKMLAWWHCRQGLDGSLAGAEPAAVLARAGWARSVGSANPYLTLFARAGTSKERAELAADKLEIAEICCARGCAYYVPNGDWPVGLAAGGAASSEAELKTAAKLGFGIDELRALENAVMDALREGPQDPRQLKERLGSLVRSFGEEGKKKGVTTSLPLALGSLQASGFIRRLPLNGRLDQERYAYAPLTPSPFADGPMGEDLAYAELAAKYWRWLGAACLADFAKFAGLSHKRAAAAAAGLNLSPLEGDLLATPEDSAAFARFSEPTDPSPVFISPLDSMILLRRRIDDHLDKAESEAARAAFAFAFGRGLQDLECHAILDRGALIGFWDYDPASGELVAASWRPKTKGLREAFERTSAFVATLGDARTMSLDGPASRAVRINGLRAAAGSFAERL